jgi:hypothetical protein
MLLLVQESDSTMKNSIPHCSLSKTGMHAVHSFHVSQNFEPLESIVMRKCEAKELRIRSFDLERASRTKASN